MELVVKSEISMFQKVPELRVPEFGPDHRVGRFMHSVKEPASPDQEDPGDVDVEVVLPATGALAGCSRRTTDRRAGPPC